MTKKYDLTSLEIKKAIVLDIPKHKKDDFTVSPIFSEQQSVLTPSLSKFFKESIIKALARDRSFKICYNDKSTSPVNKCISGILTDNKKFVHESKEIGQHLHNI